MNRRRTSEPCKMGEVVSALVDGLAPVERRRRSVAEAWEELLPDNLRTHCRLAGFAGGCLRVSVDTSAYLYELQLCKSVLLEELQQRCPGARLRRIEVGMMR